LCIVALFLLQTLAQPFVFSLYFFFFEVAPMGSRAQRLRRHAHTLLRLFLAHCAAPVRRSGPSRPVCHGYATRAASHGGQKGKEKKNGKSQEMHNYDKDIPRVRMGHIMEIS